MVDARHILFFFVVVTYIIKNILFSGGGSERGGGGECLCRGVGLTSQSSKAGSPSGRAVKDKIKQSDSQTTPGAGALRLAGGRIIQSPGKDSSNSLRFFEIFCNFHFNLSIKCDSESTS